MTRPSAARLAAGIALGALLVSAGCGKKPQKAVETPATAVEVVKAQRGTIDSVVEVTGSIKALDDVVLAAKMGGRVVGVPFREGDRVGRGGLVVQQETSDYHNQVASATAAVAAARVRLSQARTTAGIQDVSSVAAVRQAQEALNSAREQLSVVKTGARKQERAQAESAVASARASYDNARINLERTQKLYNQGAVSRASLDADEHVAQVAKASLDSAQQALSLIQEGSRQEDIRVAQNNVRAAEERLRQAKADLKQRSLRREDIQAAQASLNQSEAALAMARQSLADASIHSPVAGVVAERHVEPGEMVGAGASLIRVYNPSTIYFEATVPEEYIGKIRVGQTGEVRATAAPDKVYTARIAKVYPAATLQNRAFTVRLAILNPDSNLKPGMFARGRAVVERHTNQVILPTEALLESPSGISLFVVARGKVTKPAPSEPSAAKKPQMITTEGWVATKRRVQIGVRQDGRVEIMSGLQGGETVVRTGQSFLRNGQEVSIVGSASEAAE